VDFFQLGAEKEKEEDGKKKRKFINSTSMSFYAAVNPFNR
jgi:hypothetical protein